MSPENTGPAAVIVLAAGAGTRMKSRTPKILHEIGGRSLVGHALQAARSISPRELALVVRHERDLVAAHVSALVRSGELPAIKLGGRGQWRVEASELEAYIARMYDQTREFVSTHRFGRPGDDADPDAPGLD